MPGHRKLPPVRGGTAFLPMPETDRIDIDILAALYLAGTRRVVAEPQPGDLGGGAISGVLSDRVARLNALLASRGLERVRLKSATSDELRAWKRVLAEGAVDNPARRGIFTRMAARPVSSEAPEEEPEKPPLSRLQEVNSERVGALFLHVPVIDPARCSGCNACVNACPEDVLIVRKDGTGGFVYHAEVKDCTGCALCWELCETDAIELEDMEQAPVDVALNAFVCAACGAPVYKPLAGSGAGDLCRICRNTGHHRKLHQVLT